MGDVSSHPAPEAVAHFNRANAAFRAGDWARALAGYDAALAVDAALEPAALQAARCLVRLERWMPAREAFARTLRLNPASYSAWLEAGHLCRRMGQREQALGAYRRAIGVAPDRFEAPLALANGLEAEGRSDQAEASLGHAERAARRAGAAALFTLHRQMARYRLERGDEGRARHSLEAALAAASAGGVEADDVAEARLDLGELLLRQGLGEQAGGLLTAASAATREATLARLAELAFRHQRWNESMDISRRNVALHPRSLWARWNLAHVLAECWRMDEAEVELARAEALAPMPGAAQMRATIASRRGDADTALALYRELAARPDAPPTAAASAAMASLYSDRLDARAVADLHRALFAPLGRVARDRDSFRCAPLAGRRLRLGLVSADLHHQHPVNIFMQPLLREIDRSRFEVFLYDDAVSRDEQSRLARSRVDHWIDATALDNAQLARRIDADGIDLLLDLAGHTAPRRTALFAGRAAPVQAIYLGYPGSTGVPNMDWLLGDEVVTPPGCEALYSERIARLPGTVFCYAPETGFPFPDHGPARAARPPTFGSFNNLPKLTPRTLRLWSRALQAVPGSRLLLKAPSFRDPQAVRLMGERFAALGVDPARVEYRGPSALPEMMAEYADVDIALDPVPYNGGTTTLQALWMGVPVVTLAGEHFVSRMGASFMRAAGMDDWVARDDDGYVALARDRMAGRDALFELKRGLRERLKTRRGWDVGAHTRSLEDALAGMMDAPRDRPASGHPA